MNFQLFYFLIWLLVLIVHMLLAVAQLHGILLRVSKCLLVLFQPATLPTSKNYPEMRDRLRLRLKKKVLVRYGK